MSELWNLLNQRLRLVEDSRNDKLSSVKLYTETLPSLLVQAIGLLERKMQDFNDTPGLKKKKFEFTNLEPATIDEFKQRYCPSLACWILESNVDYEKMLENYSKILSIIDRPEINHEISCSINKLSVELQKKTKRNKLCVFLPDGFIRQTLDNAVNYRNQFAHAHINKRPLSVIANTDY